MKNNISQNTKPQTKTKAPNIKKGEVRNPKGRGAETLKTKLSFSEVLEKAMNWKK
jgi:hypothetical protein